MGGVSQWPWSEDGFVSERLLETVSIRRAEASSATRVEIEFVAVANWKWSGRSILGKFGRWRYYR